MSEQDIAWAAGLFEGEGNIYSANGRNWELNLTSTDPDVIEKFAEAVGLHGTRWEGQRPNRKRTYKWNTGRATEVRRILTLFLPYFGERRTLAAKAAIEGLEWSVSNAKVCSLDAKRSTALPPAQS